MKITCKSVLLSLLLSLALCLSSCGVIYFNRGTEGENSDTDGVTDAVTEDLDKYEQNYSNDVTSFMKDLSGKTYGGATVQIAVAGKDLIIPDDTTPTVIADDMREAVATVEEKLDISIITKKTDPDTMLDSLKASVRSGDYYADIVMLPQSYIGAYVAADAVINLRSLPGFDTNPGYIYPSALSAGTGGDSVYAVAGPASLDADSLSCVYFNKSIISSLGLESPYDLADRGEWTKDKYAEYANAVSTLSGEETYYSYGSQNTTPYLADLFFFAFGGILTESNIGYYPVLSLNGDASAACVESVKGAVNLPSAYGSSLESIDAFLSGKMLFLVDRLSTMSSLANASFDWGLLPLPKVDSEQENYISLSYYEDAMFFAGAATATDYEACADVISALNINSYGYKNDAYILNASYYYLRDNRSMTMLSYILSNPIYDFAYSFGEKNSYVANGTFMAVRNTVAGISSLQRYLDMYNRLFENSMYSMFKVIN